MFAATLALVSFGLFMGVGLLSLHFDVRGADEERYYRLQCRIERSYILARLPDAK